MQNRYAGDVGDFSKFSLLKGMFSAPDYRLGLVWYLCPDEKHNTDGRHINYVHDPKYKACDPDLIEKLSLVTNGERSIAHLERLNILPANTIYYSAPLDFYIRFNGQSKADKQSRHNGRIKWLDNACKAVEASNVICLDPDNGLEVKSVPRMTQIKAGKYAYYPEVLKLYENKQACVIYQHLHRTDTHKNQIIERATKLKEMIPDEDSVFAIRFSPYSPRAYFIIASSHVSQSIELKLKQYLNSPCGNFWDSYLKI